MSKLQKDFTQGSIGKSLIAFSMPFLLSNILQALYGAVDMLVVGNWSNPDPAVRTAILSGVNIGSQITHLVAMMISGLTVAGTVMVGQYVGAKKQKDASQTVGTMFTMLGIAGVVIMVLMIALSGPLLHLLQTPPEAFQHARDYLIICLTGTLFIFGYNAIASIQRGLGDSIRPLFFVGIACVINIVLDLLLVKGFNMGAAGAAWATVVAQAVSFLISALYLSRSRFIFDFKLRSFRMQAEKVKMMIKIGIPSSVQSIIVNISFLVMTALVNAIGGTEASAAVGVVGKFNSFAILPAVAMSSSVSAFAAQNIGAGQFERAKKSLWVGISIAMSLGVTIFALVQLLPGPIIGIFDQNPITIENGIQYMRAFSFDYLLVPALFCFNGLIMGAGHTTFTMLTGSLSSLFLRIPVALVCGSVLGWGLLGVGAAAPAASLCAVVLAGWFVLSGKWLHNKTGIRRDPTGELAEEK
ncbi:MAG: MATE family efflux transporter [Clostridiales bacterium]|nr:MATE family efflux transporter [Clostridiales bacterium]